MDRHLDRVSDLGSCVASIQEALLHCSDVARGDGIANHAVLKAHFLPWLRIF